MEQLCATVNEDKGMLFAFHDEIWLVTVQHEFTFLLLVRNMTKAYFLCEVPLS